MTFRARTLTTFRAADEASNRFQEHVKEVLNPVLRSLTSSPAWIAPPLLNGWVNWGTGQATAGYYREPGGRVWLKGSLKGGAIGAVIFDLPDGYRPLEDHDIPCRSNNGTNDVVASFRVQATGHVFALNGANTVFCVEGSFMAEASP